MIYGVAGNILDKAYNIDNTDCEYAFNKNGSQVYKSIDAYIDDRVLIFEDNFDDDSLNQDIWFGLYGNIVGAENEFLRPQNAYLENGYLVLTEKREKHLTYDWTHPYIFTHGKKTFLFGRFEAKIKTDGTLNSAFWLVGDKNVALKYNDNGGYDYLPQTEGIEGLKLWPASGEIDIVETFPKPQCNLWAPNTESISHGEYTNITVDDMHNNWHIYALEWTDTYIAAFVDGNEYHRWTFSDFDQNRIDAYKREPQAIAFEISAWNAQQLRNLDPSVTELKMYVDWVRVYAPLNINEKVQETSIRLQESLRLKEGYQCYLYQFFTPEYTSDRKVEWYSEDESIVQCDDGYIYGISQGETDIYAISKNYKVARCHVTVIDANDPVVPT